MGRSPVRSLWGMALLSLFLAVVPGSINLAITLLPFLLILGIAPRHRRYPRHHVIWRPVRQAVEKWANGRR